MFTNPSVQRHTTPVIPKYLYQVEFPAGETAPIPPARRPKPKRTQEDRQRVEAVLKVSIFPLKKYISPEMVDSIRKSPYYVHDKDVIVLRCHQHLTQRRNQQQCIRNVSIFIRNVANEIVYRESKTAADKMVDSEEKESNHSQIVFLSEAETKAMAWNLKKSFTSQVKQRRKAERAESPNASIPPGNQTED
ncbi:MAG: hypothetical protein Q9175_007340 [Cornicularia normoerica]